MATAKRELWIFVLQSTLKSTRTLVVRLSYRNGSHDEDAVPVRLTTFPGMTSVVAWNQPYP